MSLKQKKQNYKNIPAELTQYKQWVVADSNKVPYNPITKNKAKPTDPATWATFEDCVNAVDDIMFFNIGFVLTANDPYCIIDLDDKEELNDNSEKALTLKKERDRVFALSHNIDTYIEASTSGKGVHIVGKATLPYNSGVRKGLVEVYADKRYMIFTGNTLTAGNSHIGDISSVVNDLWLKYKGERKASEINPLQLSKDELQSDDDILKKIYNSNQQNTFIKAINGDYLAMPNCQSLSEAYYYVVRTLAKYTADPLTIQRIVLDSPVGQMELKKKGDRFHKMVLELAEDAISQEEPYRMATYIETANHIDNLEPFTELSTQSNFDIIENVKPQSVDIIENCLNDICSSGALKLIKEHMLEVSYNKNEDIACIASLAFMQALVSRKYQVMSGGQPIGLNQYMLVAARTGYGKDALSSGIHNLKNRYAMEKASVEINNYFGAGSYSSGVAFIKAFQIPQPKTSKNKKEEEKKSTKYSDLFAPDTIEDCSKMCFLSILNESATLFKTMASGKDIYKNGLMSSILEFYTKSGKYATVQPHEKADKDENTSILYSPSFSVLAELTNIDLKELYSSTLVDNGFLPRFLIFDIKKKEASEPNNPNGNERPLNKTLVEYIDKMIRIARRDLNNPNRNDYFINIQWQPDALKKFREFEDIQNKLRSSFYDKGLKTIADMINRNNLKALKLIGLLAVNETIADIHNSNDLATPVITLNNVIKATQLIDCITNNYIDDYNQGIMGSAITANVMRVMYECDNTLYELLPFKDSLAVVDEATGEEVLTTNKEEIGKNTEDILGADAFKYNPYIIARSYLENINIKFNDDSFFKNNSGIIDYMLKMGLLRELNVKELGMFPPLMEEYFNTNKRQAFYYRTNDWNKFKLLKQIKMERLSEE